MMWTPEMDAILTGRLKDGLSAQEIADIFTRNGSKMSRNAIIGRKHRLGMCTDANSNHRAYPSNRNPPSPRLPKPLPIRDYRPGPENGLTIFELAFDSCRFPFGEPGSPEFRYCGAEKHGEKPYCVEHCERSYIRATRRGGFKPWTPQVKREYKQRLLDAAE